MQNEYLPEQIAETIISDIILPSSLSPGSRLPSVRELQKKFEVSTFTIVAALDALEGRGIISRQHGIGCYLKRRPNHTPSHAKKCKEIGLLYPTFTTQPVLEDLLSGITRICKIHQIKLSTCKVESYADEKTKTETMVDSGVDALIVYPVPRTIKQFRNDYLASELKDFPIILIDLAYPSQMRTNITFDNYQLGLDITLKLLEEGHRNIAFKKLKSKNREIYYRSNNDRYAGYVDALESKGITPFPELCWSENFSNHLKPEENLALNFLRDFKEKPLNQRPTAVIALEDNHAAALIRCAKKENIKIPEDLKVIGFDNNPQARKSAQIPFPTTCPDFFKMGTFSANLAARETQKPSPSPLNYVLPVDIKWV